MYSLPWRAKSPTNWSLLLVLAKCKSKMKAITIQEENKLISMWWSFLIDFRAFPNCKSINLFTPNWDPSWRKYMLSPWPVKPQLNWQTKIPVLPAYTQKNDINKISSYSIIIFLIQFFNHLVVFEDSSFSVTLLVCYFSYSMLFALGEGSTVENIVDHWCSITFGVISHPITIVIILIIVGV